MLEDVDPFVENDIAAGGHVNDPPVEQELGAHAEAAVEVTDRRATDDVRERHIVIQHIVGEHRQGFVDPAELGPRYYDRPYYLVPTRKSEKGYVLLRETLRQTAAWARGLGEPDVLTLNVWATQGLFPDLVVLLHIEPERGLERTTEPPTALLTTMACSVRTCR